LNRPLDTDRLHLRPFTADDLEGWHAIWGDPAVISWGANECLDVSRRQLEGLVRAERERWPDGMGWLAVLERGSHQIVGDVLLQPAQLVQGVEIGWHMRRQVWGRGYATEAVRAVVERAFVEGACDAVHAFVDPANGASVRVAEKVGMHVVGTLGIEGTAHDHYVLRTARASHTP